MNVGTMPEKRRANPLLLISLAIFGLIIVLIGFRIGGPVKHSYGFVTSDHPIDMWEDGNDKWSYFMQEPQQDITIVAEAARKELLPLGFTEDNSQRPWYRFVKGNVEVVVCYHNEFAVDQSSSGGTKLIKGKLPPGARPPEKKWSCVLVKNGLGTETSMALFSVKKLVRGW